MLWKEDKGISEPKLDAGTSGQATSVDWFWMPASTATWGLQDYMDLLGLHHVVFP